VGLESRRTVAHENVDEARPLSREGELHRAAETCGGCFVLVGPAVVGDAAEGEVGLVVWSVADGHCWVGGGDGVEGKKGVENCLGWSWDCGCVL